MYTSKFRVRIIINFILLFLLTLILLLIIGFFSYLIILPDHGKSIGFIFHSSPVNTLLSINIFIGIFLLIMLYGGFSNAYIINISDKAITIKHVFTRFVTVIEMSQLDGLFEYFSSSTRGRLYHYYVLVQNRKAKKILLGYYYSNDTALKESLAGIPNLNGEIKPGYMPISTQIKILFGKPFL